MSDPYGAPKESPELDYTGKPNPDLARQYVNHDLKTESKAKRKGPGDSIFSSKTPWHKGNYNFALLATEGDARPPVPVGFTSDDVFVEVSGLTGNVTIQYKNNFEDETWKDLITVDGSTPGLTPIDALNGVFQIKGDPSGLGSEGKVVIRAR